MSMRELDKRLYLSKLPDVLKDNEDFQVFIESAVNSFNIDLANIEKFNDLVNPDKVPIEFIEYLGSVVGYKYVPQADDNFNRELLMRMQYIYGQRGTDSEIKRAAIHGNNEGWLGADVFVPGYEISKDEASLSFYEDRVFIHDRSKFSSSRVYPDDSQNMCGVLIIQVGYVDDDIRAAIDKTIPAGVKYYFKYVIIPAPCEEDGEFGAVSNDKMIPNTDYGIDISIYIDDEKGYTLIHSDHTTLDNIRSGRALVTLSDIVEYASQASMLPIGILSQLAYVPLADKNNVFKALSGEYFDSSDRKDSRFIRHKLDYYTNSFETRKTYKGIPVRSGKLGDLSEKSKLPIRSGYSEDVGNHTVLSFSGIETRIIDNLVEIVNIRPNEHLYPVKEVEDKYVDGYIKNYSSEVEISMDRLLEAEEDTHYIAVTDDTELKSYLDLFINHKFLFKHSSGAAFSESYAYSGEDSDNSTPPVFNISNYSDGSKYSGRKNRTAFIDFKFEWIWYGNLTEYYELEDVRENCIYFVRKTEEESASANYRESYNPFVLSGSAHSSKYNVYSGFKVANNEETTEDDMYLWRGSNAAFYEIERLKDGIYCMLLSRTKIKVVISQ